MAFTKSKNVEALKAVLCASGGQAKVFTDDQTQFSFDQKNRVINVYLNGTVTGQGQPDAALDTLIEAHITSTNAVVPPQEAQFQTSVR